MATTSDALVSGARGAGGWANGHTSYKRVFEDALAKAVTENAAELAKVLVDRAKEGDGRMMAVLLDRLVPRINRHELDAGSGPTKIVFSWQGEVTAPPEGDV